MSLPAPFLFAHAHLQISRSKRLACQLRTAKATCSQQIPLQSASHRTRLLRDASENINVDICIALTEQDPRSKQVVR